MYDIPAYFKAERAESMLFMLMGVLALALGFYFYKIQGTAFLRGMAIPLALIALIQIVVGSTVFVRSPKDIVRVEGFLQNDRGRIAAEELPRMAAVMKNFQTYKYVEIALIVVGAGLFFAAGSDFWRGVGLGLAVQAAVMLTLDFFAMSRGAKYVEFLQALQ